MNVGEVELLDKMLSDFTDSTDEQNFILRLYSTSYTPINGSDRDDFTDIEATFTNYTQQTLTRSGWNAAQTNGDSKAESSYATQSWTCGTNGDTIYGYWVEDGVDGTLLWAEEFGTARALADTDVLNLTPKFTLATETDN